MAEMDKTRAVYGIDLGTTYSCISQVDKFDQAIVLTNFEGEQVTPSAVYFESTGSEKRFGRCKCVGKCRPNQRSH